MNNTGYIDGIVDEADISSPPIVRKPFKGNRPPDVWTRQTERMFIGRRSAFAEKIHERFTWANLLTYSQQLDHATWTKTAATVTADAGIAPDGYATADALVEDITNAAHRLSKAATVAAGALTLGVAIKAAGRQRVRLSLHNATDGRFAEVSFDLSSRLGFKVVAGSVVRVNVMENGWRYFAITGTATVPDSAIYIETENDPGANSYAGDGASGLLLWRPTLVAGTSAPPLIDTTDATRAVSAPLLDADDPLSFLVREEDPQDETSDSAKWFRVFSRVPRQQTIQGSVRVVKPSLSGNFPQAIGNYAVFQPDTSLLKFDAYARRGVTSDTGAAGFYPSGGTWTITFDGATTGALAYNASAADVQTALNALTPISNRGNVTVTGTYNSAGGFTITFNNYATGSVGTGSLTGYTDSSTTSSVTPTNSGYTQNVTISRVNGTISSVVAMNDVNLTVTSGGFTINGSTATNANHNQNVAGAHANIASFNGGNYSLTIFGQTTANIAWNASFASVQAALNALSNVAARGGCVVGPAVGAFNTAPASDNRYIRFSVTFPDGVFTGGTYTITIFGQTTAGIAHNASSAAIQSALNALSNVANRGGATVSGTGLSGDAKTISFGLSFANPLMDADPSSLVPAGSSVAESILDPGIGRTQKLVFTASSSVRDLFVASHGISVSDTLFIKADGAWYVGVPFTIPDPNTIRISVPAGAGYSAAVAVTEVGKRTKQGYEPGSVTAPCNRVSDYYLPGVTVGIYADSDIPLPPYQGDSATLLQAIFAGIGTLNYEVGDLQPWAGTQILMLTKTVIDVAKVGA